MAQIITNINKYNQGHRPMRPPHLSSQILSSIIMCVSKRKSTFTSIGPTQQPRPEAHNPRRHWWQPCQSFWPPFLGPGPVLGDLWLSVAGRDPAAAEHIGRHQPFQSVSEACFEPHYGVRPSALQQHPIDLKVLVTLLISLCPGERCIYATVFGLGTCYQPVTNSCS